MKAKNFNYLRRQLLKQLISRGIKDESILAAFESVPRELFVPKNLQDKAYQDSPLPLGGGQTISQPYIVALITELIKVKAAEKILEVGSGSGYQAAILLQMGAQVYGIEMHYFLVEQSKKSLAALGYDFQIKMGDGTLGWEQFAPYDKIVVSAAAYKVPEALYRQLKPGGRIVIPLGSRQNQQLSVVEKNSDGQIRLKSICGCIFVPLLGKEGWGEG